MAVVKKGEIVMRQTIQRSISLAGIVLVTMGLAMGAPKTERAKSEITVYGRVLKVERPA